MTKYFPCKPVDFIHKANEQYDLMMKLMTVKVEQFCDLCARTQFVVFLSKELRSTTCCPIDIESVLKKNVLTKVDR